MTAIVERAVSWYLPSFDGSFIADGRITFTPSGFDTDAVADAGLIPSPIDVALGASGEGTVDLWPNVAGIRATHYSVSVRGRSVTDQRMRTFSLGKLQVMNILGPQELSDLLNVGVPPAQQVVVSFYPPGTLESFVTDAEDAATVAAASEVSAEADAVATAADRVQTGLDRTAAQTARTGAETAETNAETAETGAATARTGAEAARTGAETALTSTQAAAAIATITPAADKVPRSLLTAPHIARGWVDPSALMPFGTILRQDELVAIPQGWREFTAPASGVREIINWTMEALRRGTRVVQDLTFDPSRLFSDVEGTIPIAGPGAEVAAQKDGRNVIVRRQPVFAARPKYALEPASGVRNLLLNNRNDGAVVGVLGSGGALPTGYIIGHAGTTVTVVSLAPVDGRPNLRLRFQGTPSENILINTSGAAAISAASGQSWARSIWLSISAGSMTGLAGVNHGIRNFTTGGMYHSFKGGIITVTGAATRFQGVATIADADGSGTIAALIQEIALLRGSGPIDITLDISGPQIERAGAATALQIVGADGFDVTEAGVRPIHALAYDRQDDWMQLSTAFQPAGNYTLAMGHAHRDGEVTWLFGHSSISGLQALRGGAANAFQMRSNNTANQSSFAGSTFASATTGRAVAIARVAGTGLAEAYMNGFGPLAGTLTGAMTPPNAAGINAVGRQTSSFDAPRREYGGVLIDPGNTPVTNEEITLLRQYLAHKGGITL